MGSEKERGFPSGAYDDWGTWGAVRDFVRLVIYVSVVFEGVCVEGWLAITTATTTTVCTCLGGGREGIFKSRLRRGGREGLAVTVSS